MTAADFYTVLPFPYEGFAYFNLIDESYAQSLTMALLGEPPRDDLPRISLEGLRLELLGDGPTMDFSLTPFGIAVVSERAAAVLTQAGLASALLAATVQSAPAARAARF